MGSDNKYLRTNGRCPKCGRSFSYQTCHTGECERMINQERVAELEEKVQHERLCKEGAFEAVASQKEKMMDLRDAISAESASPENSVEIARRTRYELTAARQELALERGRVKGAMEDAERARAEIAGLREELEQSCACRFEDGNCVEECMPHRELRIERDELAAKVERAEMLVGAHEIGDREVAKVVSDLRTRAEQAERERDEARKILQCGIDRDKSDEDTLRVLAVLAVNGIYWRDAGIKNLTAQLEQVRGALDIGGMSTESSYPRK